MASAACRRASLRRWCRSVGSPCPWREWMAANAALSHAAMPILHGNRRAPGNQGPRQIPPPVGGRMSLHRGWADAANLPTRARWIASGCGSFRSNQAGNGVQALPFRRGCLVSRFGYRRRPRQAYRETRYRVLGTEPFALRVDEHSAALAATHEHFRSDCSAFVTACNPFSENVGAATNATSCRPRAGALARRRLAHIEGIGQDPSHRWPGEPGYLVFGLKLDAARTLGRELGQRRHRLERRRCRAAVDPAALMAHGPVRSRSDLSPFQWIHFGREHGRRCRDRTALPAGHLLPAAEAWSAYLLAKVKGAVLRKHLQALFDAGRHAGWARC